MINYAHNFFGKDLNTITQTDLINFFAEPRAETDTIEYKSYPTTADWINSLTKILKTTSSMLNGEGGLIVWGAPIGKKPDGLAEPIFTGELTPVPIKKEQDWFINKISTSISPMPKDIRVHIINSENGSIYLIEIQESPYKPHQFNHGYFIRLDGQTKPAPHYIVQALMREIKYPDIRGVLSFKSANIVDRKLLIPLEVGIFNFSKLQNELDLNFQLLVIGGSFLNKNSLSPRLQFSMNGSLVQTKVRLEPLYFGMPHVDSLPILVSGNTNKLQFLLSFGGRYSPAKTSRYSFDLTNFNIDDIWSNLIEQEENSLFKEKQGVDETLSVFKKGLLQTKNN